MCDIDWVEDDLAVLTDVEINDRRATVYASVDKEIRKHLSDTDLYDLLIKTAVSNDKRATELSVTPRKLFRGVMCRTRGEQARDNADAINVTVDWAPAND